MATPKYIKLTQKKNTNSPRGKGEYVFHHLQVPNPIAEKFEVNSKWTCETKEDGIFFKPKDSEYVKPVSPMRILLNDIKTRDEYLKSLKSTPEVEAQKYELLLLILRVQQLVLAEMEKK